MAPNLPGEVTTQNEVLTLLGELSGKEDTQGTVGIPLQYSCLKNPMNGGAWWAAVRGVAKRHD